MINVSEETSGLIRDDFDLSFRGEIEAKNRGKLKMYFVDRKKDILQKVPMDSDKVSN